MLKLTYAKPLVPEIRVGQIPVGTIFEGSLFFVQGVMLRTSDGVVWLPSGIVPYHLKEQIGREQYITGYRPYLDAELILK